MDFENSKNPVDQLVHLYEDGAFNRRDLIRRVAKYTGSLASAAVMMDAMAVPADAQQASCLADVRVPEDAEDLESEVVMYPGQASTVLAYLSRRRDLMMDVTHPAVLVIHENAGLTAHIKDVTRRIARAGFIGLGVQPAIALRWNSELPRSR